LVWYLLAFSRSNAVESPVVELAYIVFAALVIGSLGCILGRLVSALTGSLTFTFALRFFGGLFVFGGLGFFRGVLSSQALAGGGTMRRGR
jgi:hypothetical protein